MLGEELQKKRGKLKSKMKPKQDMEEGLVTITMSVFNGEVTISRAIDSVITQTYEQWELIIIDDASTDKTFDLLLKYQALDDRIKIFRNKINRGTYYNRNRAMLFGTGEFITNLDADDSFEPQKLDIQLQEMGSTFMVSTCQYRSKQKGKEDLIFFGSSTLLFRKSILQEIGYFDSVRYGADTEFLRRARTYYEVNSIRQILYNYTIREGSLTESPITGLKSKLGKEKRETYENNYLAWHADTISPYLPFPQVKRAFPLGHSSQACTREKITVSIATFPERIHALRKSVHSIYPWVDQINVFLNEYAEIPKFLLKYKKINPVLADYDRGDTGKFYWSSEVQGYHFTCDDDIIYSRQYFEMLLQAIEKYNREAIVGIHGSIIKKSSLDFYSGDTREVIPFKKALDIDKKVQFLGTGVMAYHTDKIRIPLSIFKEINMADIFVGVYAQQKNIPLIRCASKGNMVSTVDLNGLRSIYQHSKENRSTKFNKRVFIEQYLTEHWKNPYPLNSL